MKIKKKVRINIEIPASSIEEVRCRIAAYLRREGFISVAKEVEEGIIAENKDGRYWSIIFDPSGLCITSFEEEEEFINDSQIQI